MLGHKVVDWTSARARARSRTQARGWSGQCLGQGLGIGRWAKGKVCGGTRARARGGAMGEGRAMARVRC